jgi:hypothetical protein
MIKRTPQQLGRDYEADFARRYGGNAQPASGAGPRHKLDWRMGTLLASLKHTIHRSYRLTAEELQEALAGAQGPGGRGEIPAMVIKMDGFPDDVIVMRAADLRSMFEGEVEVSFAPTKRSARLAAARQRLKLIVRVSTRRVSPGCKFRLRVWYSARQGPLSTS